MRLLVLPFSLGLAKRAQAQANTKEQEDGADGEGGRAGEEVVGAGG